MSLRETKPWLFLTSSAKNLEGMISLQPSDNPRVFHVDELIISELTNSKTGSVVNVTLTDKYVLYCHGNTESSEFYSASGIKLEDYIREYEERSKIDAVIVCNPQRFRLGENKIYLLGDAPSTSLYKESERLVLKVTKIDGNLEIHI